MRIIFGRFIAGRSPLHQVDPRIKLLGTCILISAGLLVGAWLDLVLVAATAVITVIASGSRYREVLKDIWSLRFFYLVTFVLHCILGSGEPLLDLPLGLSLTVEGMERGLFFSVKIALLAVFIGSLMRTTHPASWVNLFNLGSGGSGSIGRLTAPLGLTLGIAVRFLPLILEEAERIRWAQVSRGFRYKGGLLKRVRSTGKLLVPLLTSSLDRVDGITTAMQARGFRLDSRRSKYDIRRLGVYDMMSILLVLLVVIMVLV